MGPSVRQSRRHPRDRRLAVAQGGRRRAQATHGARPADGDDQGPRDPGRHGTREFLQSRRARSRDPGARRDDRRGHGHARRHARADHQCRFQCLDRRRGASHLPARAEYRFTQELGGRRCDEPRTAPCADRDERRNGLSVCALGAQMGLLRRAVQGPAIHVPPAVWQLRHGKRAVQDQLSRRVPRADRG